MTEPTDTQIHKIAIDDIYKDNALEKIKKAVKGNRYDPEKIILNRFEGEVLHFQAESLIDVTMSFAKRTEPGKVTGSAVAGSETAINDLVNREYLSVRSDPSIAQKVRNIFTSRKDQGFAQDGLKIPLKFWRKSFVMYIPCSSCRSRGVHDCSRCAGRGRMQCNRCYGSGMCVCTNCNGMQMISDGGGGRRQCTVCGGNGKISCPGCQQTGWNQCTNCGGKGNIKCNNCNGLAWLSNITEVTLEAKAKFDYPRDRLPDNVVQLIEQEKDQIAEHAEIHVAMNQTSHVNMNDQQKMEEARYMEQNKVFRVPILYNVILPYSHMEYDMGGKTYYTFLFGKQGMLSHVSPFLDDLLVEPMRKLQDAAEGRGSVGDSLKKAATYRTTREAIILSTRYNTARAQQQLLKHNPLGLSKEKAKAIVHHADKALSDITKGPRMAGFLLGHAITIAIMCGYFLTPVRGFFLSKIGPVVPEVVVDILVGILCAYLAYVLIQVVAGQRVKALMQQIMPKQKATAHVKLGTTGFYSVLFSIAAFFGVLEVARRIPGQEPIWYLDMLGMILYKIFG